MRREDLNNYPDEILQRHGIEKFADLGYRVEIARLMALHFNAEQVLLFDDVVFAVPEAQRPKLHALPGYERALLPGLLLATGFDNGASVLVAAPPNPVERQIVLGFHNILEEKLGRLVPYRILFEWNNKMLDLTQLPDDEYEKLCLQYAQTLNDPNKLPAFGQWYHLNVFTRQAATIIGNDRTLVMPFQVTEEHKRVLDYFINNDQVVIPSIPNLDKATNNFLLREAGYEDIPTMTVVAPDGNIITDLLQLQEYQSTQSQPIKATEENIVRFAQGLLTAVDRLAQEGKRAYIKLDSNGVSGLGNIVPTKENEAIYDVERPYEERIGTLIKAIRSNKYEQLPATAVVEELVEPNYLEGVKHDLTVGGMMIDGVFYPMSIFPFAVNESDEYIAGWMANQASTIGESKEDWKTLFESFAQMGKIMADNGYTDYTDGVLAGDVLIGRNGERYLHDYNFRRGGRSHFEALIALLPGGFFEAQIEIDKIPQGLANEQRYLLYTEVCRHLYNQGILPFSTAFGYFGGDHEEGKSDFLKLKIAVPIKHPSISEVPRNEHLGAIHELVSEVVNSILTEKNY